MNKGVFGCILVVSIILTNDSSAQTRRATREPSLPIVGAEVVQRDTVATEPMASYEEVARRVDSLQFIMVHNADLLRENLDRRLIWVYAMLGLIIIACMIIYGTLSSAQRQRKEFEERISRQGSASVSQLENRIEKIEAAIEPRKPPPKPTARRAKKSR